MTQLGGIGATGGARTAEAMAVHETSLPHPAVVALYDPGCLEGLHRLAAAVESEDSRLLGQLWHVGRQQLWSPVRSPLGVSSEPDAYSWTVPHVMRPDEIRRLVDAYVAAARRLEAAGFSGAELHGAHGYLIAQFLSPWSNTRQDEYGGDRERRLRFVREIIAGIRGSCRRDFILGLKMPGDEGVPGGIDPEEAGAIVERLVADGGLDYFATGATMRRPASLGPDAVGESLRDYLTRPDVAPPGGIGAQGTAVLFDQDHGAATYAAADLLAQRVRRVVLLTPHVHLGRQVPYVSLLGVYRRLYRAGVVIVPAAIPVAATAGSVTWRNVFSGQEETISEVALFVWSTPRVADDTIAEELRRHGLSVLTVGDAHAPRGLLAAIHEAHAVATQL